MFNPILGYRRAVVKTTQRTGSTPRKQAPAKYVFHVTVGRRLYDYPYPPHFTVAWGGGLGLPVDSTWDLNNYYLPETPRHFTASARNVLRLQHCDVTKTSYALKGPGAPPRAQCETNHMGHVLQCEYTMPAVNRSDSVADWEYEIIASETAAQIQGFRDAMGDQTLIDTTKIRDWHGSAAYGFGDPYEMTCAEYEAYDGLLGHVDIPGQDHWDPGNWDHELLSRLVTTKLEGSNMRTVIVLKGSNRYATAGLVNAFDWQPGDVALCSGRNESLVDSLLAAHHAPIALTNTDTLSPFAAPAIRASTRVIAVGALPDRIIVQARALV